MHTYDFIGVLNIFAMFLAFFLFYLIEDALTVIYQLSHTFSTFASTVTQTYLSIMFSTVSLIYILDPLISLAWRLAFNRNTAEAWYDRIGREMKLKDSN